MPSGGVRQIGYVYDMGDNWQHRIIVEKLKAAEPGALYPQFLGGERRCPHGQSDIPFNPIVLVQLCVFTAAEIAPTGFNLVIHDLRPGSKALRAKCSRRADIIVNQHTPSRKFGGNGVDIAHINLLYIRHYV
jgi:hypothetical protein